MTPADLAHALPMMLPKKGAPAAVASEQTEASSSLELPLEDLQRLRLRQEQNARIYERQKRRVHFPLTSVVLSPLKLPCSLLRGIAWAEDLVLSTAHVPGSMMIACSLCREALSTLQNGIVDDSWGVSLGPSAVPLPDQDKLEGNLQNSGQANGQPKLPHHKQTGQSSLGSSGQHNSSNVHPQKSSSSSSAQRVKGSGSISLSQAAPNEQSVAFSASSRARGHRGNRGPRGRGHRPLESAIIGGRHHREQTQGRGTPQERQQSVIHQ